MRIRLVVALALVMVTLAACGSAQDEGAGSGTSLPDGSGVTGPTIAVAEPTGSTATSGTTGSQGGSGTDGSAPPTTAAAGGGSSSRPGGSAAVDGAGTVAVELEEVDGVFIEGFEIGLRFEQADGTVIASTLWSDFVIAQGDTSMEAWYDSVLQQPVPAGPVVVWAQANVGIGPGPVVPDVEGNLPCRLDVEVPPGGTVRVRVGFTDPTTCLTLIEG